LRKASFNHLGTITFKKREGGHEHERRLRALFAIQDGGRFPTAKKSARASKPCRKAYWPASDTFKFHLSFPTPRLMNRKKVVNLGNIDLDEGKQF